jgi:transcriptional regulator with XRE-family HTH domain
MATRDPFLRALGEQIRTTRIAAGLTQNEVGKRAGIVGKYVSEIERGTRDVPLSTLRAVVERGLGLRLELELCPKHGSRPRVRLPPLPPGVEEVARAVADLSSEDRSRVLAIVKTLVGLVKG